MSGREGILSTVNQSSDPHPCLFVEQTVFFQLSVKDLAI